MKLRSDGQLLRDDAGRHRVFHGINLVAKGTSLSEGSFVDHGFKGSWDGPDIADLASRGCVLSSFSRPCCRVFSGQLVIA